ncbi:hypothetical protein [Methyloversatilis sp. XJ19-49]|uniref:hypothetical protein n=1 Tax=Methyloversatilis sp. XJ19-49 TaxID=2963429 RepID=UPI00211C3C96|nr:hypothetical protein [Methyloversatilis sp. XJ19-49]
MRQFAFFRSKRGGDESHTDRMKQRIDWDLGKRMIDAHFATVEPVFGNLRNNKQFGRFTLRAAHQGRRAMEAVLLGAQHRKAQAPWVRELGMLASRTGPSERWQAMPALRVRR